MSNVRRFKHFRDRAKNIPLNDLNRFTFVFCRALISVLSHQVPLNDMFGYSTELRSQTQVISLLFLRSSSMKGFIYVTTLQFALSLTATSCQQVMVTHRLQTSLLVHAFLTREYAKHIMNKLSQTVANMQISTYSIPRLLIFCGNSADEYLRLAHIFCLFQMR